MFEQAVSQQVVSRQGVAEDRRSIWGRGRGQALNLGVWQRTGAQFAGGAKEQPGWKNSWLVDKFFSKDTVK